MAPTQCGKFIVFTRTYSLLSAGRNGIISSRPLPSHEMNHYLRNNILLDFELHANIYNRRPTSLVSVSGRLIDSIARAFYKRLENGEPANQIKIIFITIPIDHYNRMKSEGKVQAARELAAQRGMERPEKFQHESLFVSEIPPEYVTHTVALQTLLDRDLSNRFWGHITDYSTAGLKEGLKNCFRTPGGELDVNDILNDYGAGRKLGEFVKLFGARAPDSISCHFIDEIFRRRLEDGGLIDGLEDSIVWDWLMNPKLLVDYENYQEWYLATDQDCQTAADIRAFKEEAEVRAVRIGL
ncbi:hypothetical protein OOU_Y34scaffold00967g1 [Pyricularia oryzae Y34]|uniref:Uncharacterized protein n=1 Tax=Pyricularia oryzae (strain Y34) TaxID=1143189 RepID=A0AA97NND7_PYRO3|nr:hypothetical protein OOU_Y34scaffold00967g1 [Pyricularia oryzae Y34]